MTGLLKKNELYGQGVQILKQNDNKTIYNIDCGKGTMTVFKLFPGIELIYNDFHTSTCPQMAEPLPDIMEINHCRRGRFECEFKRGSYAYMGEDDVAVNMWENETNYHRFPLGVYQGASVVINIRTAQDNLSRILDGVAVDLGVLREKLCTHNRCLILKAPVNIQHIFEEIYLVDPKIQMGYLRLKILELLLILSVLPPIDTFQISPYFSVEQVQKVKYIREHLTTSLDKNITLKELAAEYEISPTGLKNCFKAIHGKTVYAFRREYRMQAAAKMLQETSLTIAEIAGTVGYENPGKFSAAFREIMGLTPGEYRKK